PGQRRRAHAGAYHLPRALPDVPALGPQPRARGAALPAHRLEATARADALRDGREGDVRRRHPDRLGRPHDARARGRRRPDRGPQAAARDRRGRCVLDALFPVLGAVDALRARDSLRVLRLLRAVVDLPVGDRDGSLAVVADALNGSRTRRRRRRTVEYDNALSLSAWPSGARVKRSTKLLRAI